MKFLHCVSIIAVLAATCAATSYQWSPSCSGAYTYSSAIANCFSPEGSPTVNDDITFPTGTSVTFGATISDSAYYPILASNVFINPNANVTLYNGMIAVRNNVFVNGTLTLSSQGTGAGPWDDGYNHPLPDYQLPGFTPNIIGGNAHFGNPHPSDAGVQSKVIVSGILSINGQYAAVFTDIDVEVPGSIVAETANFFGVVRNFGSFQCDVMYMGGTLKNEVSGVMSLGTYFNSPFSDDTWPLFINHGHQNYGWGASDVHHMNLINTGTFVFTEDARKTPQHANTARLGEKQLTGRIVNQRGGVIRFKSFRIRTNRYNISAALVNDGRVVSENVGISFANALENNGELRLRSTFVKEDVFVFSGHVTNNGHLKVELSAAHFLGGVDNHGVMHAKNKHLSATGSQPWRNTHKLMLESAYVRLSNPVVNSGEWNMNDCDAVFAASYDNHGIVTHRNKQTHMQGAVINTGSWNAQDERTNVEAPMKNAGKMLCESSQVKLMHVTNDGQLVLNAAQDIHMTHDFANTGSAEFKAMHVSFHADVHNAGTMSLSAAHSTLTDLYNEGSMSLSHASPRRSISFVEGRTFNTGNFTIHNTHLTVTSIINHGDNTIRLDTPATTLTLGTWGTSLQRGAARGYLRRQKSDTCAAPLPSTAETPEIQGADCLGMSSCDACCAESALCVVYIENVYCGGYLTDQEPFAPQQPRDRDPEHYVLTSLATSKMPPRMKRVMSDVQFHHPHVVAGTLIVSGPGAVTTTDTLEILGRMEVRDGAELFSMVEQGRSIVAGNGHIIVSSCGKWLLGNDAHQRAYPFPNVTIADGGAIVVPKHAHVNLELGYVRVDRSGQVHVDGALETGAEFTWDTVHGAKPFGGSAAQSQRKH